MVHKGRIRAQTGKLQEDGSQVTVRDFLTPRSVLCLIAYPRLQGTLTRKTDSWLT